MEWANIPLPIIREHVLKDLGLHPSESIFLVLGITVQRHTTLQERNEAVNLFGAKEAEEEAKKVSAKTFVPGEIPSTSEVSKEEQPSKRVAPTPEQIIAIKAAIVNSQTVEEVARLEKALKSGQIPYDLDLGVTNNTTVSGNVEDDKMTTDGEAEVKDGPGDANREPKNDAPADMEE